MAFVVQFKDGPKAKWKEGRMRRTHPTLKQAVEDVCSLDQDGGLSPGIIRIFDTLPMRVVPAAEYTDPANPFHPHPKFGIDQQ